MKNRRIFKAAIIISLFLFPFIELFARAGGAGGGSFSGGGGSGGSGDGAIVIYLIFLLLRSGPIGWAILAIMAVAAYFFLKYSRSITPLDKTPESRPFEKVQNSKTFLEATPGFDFPDFKRKASQAFLDIQAAWSKGEIGVARRFMSDGVYRRFSVQLEMMKQLKQSNPLSNVRIRDVFIDRIETDGNYDILHACITAEMTDQFVCLLDHSMDSPGGYEQFTEIWSFIRKRGIEVKNIFNTSNCPQCSAQLPEALGDSAKCPYCGTLVNSGEYDWILSEITQQDDYMMGAFRDKKTSDLAEKVRTILHENADFCVQLLEDRASNAFLQICAAGALNQPRQMRRFVTDSAFEKLSKNLSAEKFLYNRLYTNDCSLLSVQQTPAKNILYIGIKYTYQRVQTDGKHLKWIDSSMFTGRKVLVMEREKNAGLSKGSVYANLCPSCGAVVKNSLDIKCAYCGSLLNSSKNEWIVSGLLDIADYKEQQSNEKADINTFTKAGIEDDLYQVRDFAFNNVMMVFAADGVFADEEIKMAQVLAKRWGYRAESVGPIIQAAKAGRLSIRMPLDPKKSAKIFKMMQKAAQADGAIASEEQALLNEVEMKYSEVLKA